MIDLVGKMVREVNVPLNDAIVMATENPARYRSRNERSPYRWSGRRFGCAFAANRSRANFRRWPRVCLINTAASARCRKVRPIPNRFNGFAGNVEAVETAEPHVDCAAPAEATVLRGMS